MCEQCHFGARLKPGVSPTVSGDSILTTVRTTMCFLILAECCVTLGCRREDPVSKSIGATVSRGQGTRLALVDHTTFVWKRFCVVVHTRRAVKSRRRPALWTRFG